MKLVVLSKRRAKTCGPTRSLTMRAGMQSQLGMDLAADSLSTLARREQSFGAERFEPGGRNADEDENDRRDCARSAGTAGRSSASVVERCDVGSQVACTGD